MLLFTLALTLLQAAPAARAPSTLVIGGGEARASFSEAISAAKSGDTIRLRQGTYTGAVTVDRSLTIIAEPGAVLDGDRSATTLTIAADSVSISGLMIRNSGRSLDRDEAAIKIVECTGCEVRDTRIEDSLHGIYLVESHDIVLSGNTIVGDTELPEARRGNGIHLFHSRGVQLINNRIRNTRDGVYFSFSSGNTVVGNEVRRVRYGLHYMYSDDNVFRENQFRQNAAGAAIMFSRRILLRDNVFAEHVGYRAYGILLQTAYDIQAERNLIEGNLVGIFLDMSTRNTFRENRITGNGIGIDLIASAENNTFVGNSLDGNRTAVRKPNGAGENRWAVDGRGNYWGDRSVFDLDGDGVGDRPFSAADPFASQAALRPVLEIFSGTPAAMMLSLAERAFPVFDLPRVVDPSPLVAPEPGVPAGRHDAGDSSLIRAASVFLVPLLVVAVVRRRTFSARFS